MKASAGSRLTFALGVVLTSTAIGCGPSKDEQCKTLVGAVQTADKARIRSDRSESARDKYFDDMVAAKRVLAATEVSDEKLVALREKEWKAFEDFIHAQRELFNSKVPSELDQAVEERRRVTKIHETNVAELATYCGTTVVLASTSQPSAPAEPTAP